MRDENGLVAYERAGGDDEILIAVNAGADDKTLIINKEYTSLYNNKEYKDVVDVPGGSFVILKKNKIFKKLIITIIFVDISEKYVTIMIVIIVLRQK